MIKEKVLMPGTEFRIKNGSTLTLQRIVELISEKAAHYNIPVAFKSEQISSDLISGMLGIKKHCVLLYHPQNEKNYLRYVIQLNTQGTYAFITVNQTNGFAPNSYISAGIEGARSVIPGNEKGWYTIIDDILEELFA